MVDLIENGEFFYLLFVAFLLCFVGQMAVANNPGAIQRGKRIALLTFIGYCFLQLSRDGIYDAELLLSVVFRGMVAGGMMLGASWIVLPALACFSSPVDQTKRSIRNSGVRRSVRRNSKRSSDRKRNVNGRSKRNGNAGRLSENGNALSGSKRSRKRKRINTNERKPAFAASYCTISTPKIFRRASLGSDSPSISSTICLIPFPLSRLNIGQNSFAR